MIAGERIWGIVVAAGAGSRFGGPKHAVLLAGKPLWEWARDALLESGAGGVVVVGRVPGGVRGGPERHVSVARGLARVDPDATVVAVHDAARPLAPATMILRTYEALLTGAADAAVPVVSIPDALKRIDTGKGRVVGGLSRANVVAAQTPQVFRAGILRRAHALASESGWSAPIPDDAAMVERIGGRVVTAPGDRAAMKITYPEDLAMAEALVRARYRS